jgi:hypothetical protein
LLLSQISFAYLFVEDDDDVVADTKDMDEDHDDIDNHVVLTLRNCLISHVEKRYEQFLPISQDSYCGLTRFSNLEVNSSVI